MRKLPMSAGEIAQSYREAKDQEMQVGILADLNLCTKEEMEEILRGLGLRQQKEKKHRGRAVTFDTAKAHALWDEGRSDEEIAAALDVPVGRFREWRRREGLMMHERKKTSPEAKPKPTAKPKPEVPEAAEVKPAAPVSVRWLFNLLDEAVSKGYGDAPLTVEGQCFKEMHLVARRVFGAHEDMAVELEGTVL